MKNYQMLARCLHTSAEHERMKQKETGLEIMRQHDEIVKKITDMISGSGWNVDGMWLKNGATFVVDFSYHCLNENGFYDGYLIFKAIIMADLRHDFSVSISGQSRNKSVYRKYWQTSCDYILDTIHYWLNEEYQGE